MASVPTVLYPLTLPGLLNHILTPRSSSAPTTLIICSTRSTFLEALSLSLARQYDGRAESLQQLIAPTLHNLVTARHVNIAFCASVQALQAYLTAYSTSSSSGGVVAQNEKETLVLVNPLSLHASTPSFSAQGLSRMLAAATETALRVNAKLVLVECLGMQNEMHHHDEEREADIAMRDGETAGPTDAEENPWEREVPILNSSIRKFGSGSSERSWAGRTVKIQRIAGRWCRFHNIIEERGRGPCL
jgi:hypothetical protein